MLQLLEHPVSRRARAVPCPHVPIRVECTNCGSDEWITIASLGLAAIGLILAAVAAVVALKAAKAADDTLIVAREEAQRSSTEHDEFMRQLQARARFDVTLTPQWPADENGLITEDATETRVTIAIGISNARGDKAAGTTTINALVPRGIKQLRWSGPRGEENTTASSVTLETSETLTDADGKEFEADYLARQLPRVTRRTAYVVYFTFYVEIPRRGERTVPVKVLVESDDLPDEEPDVVRELMIRVRLRSGQ